MAANILKGALTNSSTKSYTRAISFYRSLMLIYFPSNSFLPITLEHLVLFIAFCMHKQLAYSTVLTYISMLNYVQKLAGFRDLSHNFVIKKSLEGFRKLKAKPDSRLPITPVILRRLVSSLEHLGFSHFTVVLLRAMYLLAFHAFLRVGEITGSGSDNRNNIPIDAVNFLFNNKIHPYALELNMTHFKHYNGKSFQKFLILSNAQHPMLCPVNAVWEYCKLRGQLGGPLFCFLDGQPIPRHYFNQQLRLSLHWAGCSITNFKGHSFRIGAASTAASLGVSDDMIQVMGRWRSDAFKKYIRIPVLLS